MKKSIVAGSVGLGLLALAGSASALTFNEAQGISFEQALEVTPTVGNRLLFSVSGMTSQFDSLSFSFLSPSGGPSVTATSSRDPSVLLAAFNDARNGAYNLGAGTTYQVKVSGSTRAAIPGGEATVSITALNAVVTMVPEPETYAMLLAGLGLIGGIVRRRIRGGNQG